MNKRLEFDSILREVLNITEPNGDSHVYFQPPESVKMKYPAIVYSIDKLKTDKADDRIYNKKTGYSVILIDKNPDSDYFDKILEIPFSVFDDAYTADNLNHFKFTIYH